MHISPRPEFVTAAITVAMTGLGIGFIIAMFVLGVIESRVQIRRNEELRKEIEEMASKVRPHPPKMGG